jgi:hypothetical protein
MIEINLLPLIKIRKTACIMFLNRDTFLLMFKEVLTLSLQVKTLVSHDRSSGISGKKHPPFLVYLIGVTLKPSRSNFE